MILIQILIALWLLGGLFDAYAEYQGAKDKQRLKADFYKKYGHKPKHK
jgi:hypothetical protein